MNTLINTLLLLGGMGLVFGFLLSLAAAKLKTKTNPKLESLKDILPGVNCGGCGRAGCNAFAEDIIEGSATADGCPVGGTELNEKIAGIMGIAAGESTRMVAYIKCIGTHDKARQQYINQGTEALCRAAARMAGGGPKACLYGCLGGESCKAACPFDAIIMGNGIARIDKNKCTGCKLCIAVCPKPGLIEMVPYNNTVHIGCNARDGAKSIRANCTIGCIGCKLCVKKCPHAAIELKGALAYIRYDLCTSCGDCAKVCPRRCIEN